MEPAAAEMAWLSSREIARSVRSLDGMKACVLSDREQLEAIGAIPEAFWGNHEGDLRGAAGP